MSEATQPKNTGAENGENHFVVGGFLGTIKVHRSNDILAKFSVTGGAEPSFVYLGRENLEDCGKSPTRKMIAENFLGPDPADAQEALKKINGNEVTLREVKFLPRNNPFLRKHLG